MPPDCNIITMIYCPCPTAAIADALAQHLLQTRLVGCANRLSPMQSHYWWQGALEQAEEFPLLLKTHPALAAEVFTQIQLHHPYETPAILAWEATSTADFKKWLEECTKTVASDANMQ